MTTDQHLNIKPDSRKSILIQIFTSVIASATLLTSGMTLGFTGVALPYMQKPDSFVNVDDDQASWIASLANLATPIGCLLGGPILDRLGRKNTMVLVGLPGVIGWFLIAINPSITRIYIGRLLTGLSTGLCSIPCTVYTSETTTNAMRGILVTCSSITIASGILTEYCLGWWLQEKWNYVALISGIITLIVSILVLVSVPESPVWLVSKGQNQAASKSLSLLRGTKSKNKIERELNEMIEKARSFRGHSLSLGRSIAALALPQAYKPLIILNTFFFFQQATGLFVIVFYAVEVIKHAGVLADPYMIAVLIAVLRLGSIVISVWISKAFGRRFASISSGIGLTLSMFTLVLYCYWVPSTDSPTPTALVNSSSTDWTTEISLTEAVTSMESLTSNFSLDVNSSIAQKENTTGSGAVEPAPTKHEGHSWIPIAALFSHIIFGTIGFLTVPWCMIGEVFPAQVRGVAGSLTSCFAYLSSFAIIKLYPQMLKSLGKVGVFTCYCLMSLLGTLFVFVYLPETNGKTLEAIERQFMSKSSLQQRPEEVSLQAKSKQPIIRPSRSK